MNNCPLECGVKFNKEIYSHLPKCRNKHLLGKEYLKCKYVYSHIIKKADYDEHLKKCELEQEKEKIEDYDCTDLIKILSNKNNFSESQDEFDSAQAQSQNNEVNENPAQFKSIEEVDEDSKKFYKLFIN